MKENNPEYQAGAALVDEGIKFDVPGFFGRKITLTIKPVNAGTIVRMSMLISKMKPIDENANMSQELLAKGDNLKIIAGVLAYAIIGTEIFRMWKFRYYRWLMLNRVENLKHLFSYMNIVYRQMTPDYFFFIMALTPAMNLIRKKEEKSGEGKPFGEPSPLSKKPSV